MLYAGYDALISMKVAAGREEDLRDIGALEAARRDYTPASRRLAIVRSEVGEYPVSFL